MEEHDMVKKGIVRAKYGASAYAGIHGVVPTAFPRVMGPNCLKYVQQVVESGMTVNMTARFEKAFAVAMGVKHCIATPGCTPALATLAAAFPFEPGDEIIVSPVTDYGTLQGLCAENYIPVFADADPGTVNLSAATIEPRITDRTRAILVVHKTGIICDMDPINELAKRHSLIVYEDVCQAVFGQYKGRLAGTLSLAAGYSFDAEKTMGSDVGGCVITNDDDLAESIRFLGQSRGAEMVADFGRVHSKLGYAYRMPQCTAAICLGQLEIIRDSVLHRDKMARLISTLLADIPGITPLPIPEYVDVYSCWMVGFSIDPEAFSCTAQSFAQQVADAGIPSAGQGKYYLMPAACTFLQKRAANRSYPYSMPPASREYTYSGDNCPNAQAYLECFVRWSSFCEKYQPEHCELVAEIVRKVADQNR
jgi:dTDP-4-amino-4,6-dideoxygalactose transaminase